MINALMFFLSNHYGIQCLRNLIQLEPRDVFKVISDTMQWQIVKIELIYNCYSINICNAKKTINALIFIMSNYYGI